jgi:hypothetical protein
MGGLVHGSMWWGVMSDIRGEDYNYPVARATRRRIVMKLTEPLIVSRKINAAKRRAAGRRIAANIRRLQRSRKTRTAGQALAEARGQRLAR